MSNAVTSTLTYGGVNIAALGGEQNPGYVVRRDIDAKPAKRLNKVIIPGRNGVQYVDEGAYDNVNVSYTLVFPSGFAACALVVANYVLSRTGYQQLVDAYDPDYYRLAQIAEPPQIVPTEGRDKGYVVVRFSCLPQKYAVNEALLTYTDTDPHIIVNSSAFAAKPLITVKGNGTISGYDGGYVTPPAWWTVTISGRSSGAASIIIDSDKEDCYDTLGVNCNSYVTIGYRYPLIAAGVGSETTVQASGDITEYSIQPRRWWL